MTTFRNEVRLYCPSCSQPMRTESVGVPPLPPGAAEAGAQPPEALYSGVCRTCGTGVTVAATSREGLARVGVNTSRGG